MRFLLLPFVIFPILELFVLIEVGSAIGAGYTVALVLLTAAIGAVLLRQQGLATLLKANQRMQSGEIPAREVCEGFLIAIGGALLLVPGFVTDAIGLFCLLPGSRQWLAGRILKRGVISGQAGIFGAGFGPGVQRPDGRSPFGPRYGQKADPGVVIEGEYDHENDPRRHPESIDGPRQEPQASTDKKN